MSAEERIEIARVAKTAGALAALVVVAIATAIGAWAFAFGQGRALAVEAKRKIELSESERASIAKESAKLLARSGLARAIVAVERALRAGESAPASVRGNLGASFARGQDRYRASVRALDAGTFEIEATGEVARAGEDVAARSSLKARARIAAEKWELVALEWTGE